jgi:hypothetical protein
VSVQFQAWSEQEQQQQQRQQQQRQRRREQKKKCGNSSKLFKKVSDFQSRQLFLKKWLKGVQKSEGKHVFGCHRTSCKGYYNLVFVAAAAAATKVICQDEETASFKHYYNLRF